VPSDVALFVSADTSVFHGLAASKSRLPIVVDVVAPDVEVVVLDVEVDVLELDDEDVVVVVVGSVVVTTVVGGRELVVDDVLVDVVVGRVVVVTVVGGRDVDVDEVVEVVVVLTGGAPHWHTVHASPPAQSGSRSHASPAAGSTVPSPHAEAGAAICTRRMPRPEKVPVIRSQPASSTLTVSRTLRSEPHAVHRARIVRTVPRRLVRGATAAHPLSMLT
jgi:hypothetical protein